MKKLILIVFAALMQFAFMPSEGAEIKETKKGTVPETTAEASEEVNRLENRLEELGIHDRAVLHSPIVPHPYHVHILPYRFEVAVEETDPVLEDLVEELLYERGIRQELFHVLLETHDFR